MSPRRRGVGRALSELQKHRAEELHGQYLLVFSPPKRGGKTHHIDVRIAPPVIGIV